MPSGSELKFFRSKNGKEAMEFLSNDQKNREKFKDLFPPTIILLDNIPIMNGFDFSINLKNLILVMKVLSF